MLLDFIERQEWMRPTIRPSLGSIASLVLAGATLMGCGSSTKIDEDEDIPASNTVRGPEWVESTHGKTPPDTSGAFPRARRDIVISVDPATWNSMLSSLVQACGASAPFHCNGTTLDSYDSVSAWRMADLHANGQKWASIGIRMVSNGDLADAWKDSTFRFPLRINMDKWEKERPTIDNQRFYGFQKLSLSNLSDDSTGLRHQVASAAYRSQGVPAYRSSLVGLRLAHGTDTLDLGLYSLREAIDGPMLSRWFSTDSGNLYEPSSALGSFSPTEFAEGDHDGTFADVGAFVRNLNATNRTVAPATWRSALESTFDVAGFIDWLAVSTILGDRGAYGNDSGNYALYNDRGRLRWMALSLDQTFPTGSGLARGIWHSTDAGWPLITNLLADSVYCEAYAAKVRGLTGGGGALSPTKLGELVTSVSSASLDGRVDATTRKEKLLLFASLRQSAIDTSLAAHTCPYRN